jgi:beta-phosphoglucomutase-like phosphatase (HAD superfamily)
LAVASTSAKPLVEVVLVHAVGKATAARFKVLAGDVVAAKKPAPDIYVLASEALEVAPENCVAIEDSRNGLLSALSAGIQVLVTTSGFTEGEDFSEARLVVSSLGDPGGERSTVFQNRTGRQIGEYVDLGDVAAMLRA